MDISVITPFYKGNRYMEQLFGCIRAAARAVPEKEVELVLVCDSPAEPIVYEEAWVGGFSLRIVNNAQNSGIHRSRVNGLGAARGEFVWFLDQDDLLAENAFASQLAAIGDADCVIANGFDQNPNSYGPIYKSGAHQRQAAKPRFYYTVGNQIVSPGHCMLRRSAIPGAWLENTLGHNGSDDLLLWLLMFHAGCRFAVNPELLYTHVDTGENVSANVEKMVASSMEVLELLRGSGSITPAQTRRFLRSRRMSAAYVGKGKAEKLLAILKYPDVAWMRIQLKAMQKVR